MGASEYICVLFAGMRNIKIITCTFVLLSVVNLYIDIAGEMVYLVLLL